MSTPTPRKRHLITAAQRFQTKGPTGFLHKIHAWTVEANGKQKHRGFNKRNAERAFKTWFRIAPEKVITLRKDQQVIETKYPDRMELNKL